MEKEISPVCNLEKERCLAKRRPGHECPAWVPSLAGKGPTGKGWGLKRSSRHASRPGRVTGAELYLHNALTFSPGGTCGAIPSRPLRRRSWCEPLGLRARRAPDTFDAGRPCSCWDLALPRRTPGGRGGPAPRRSGSWRSSFFPAGRSADVSRSGHSRRGRHLGAGAAAGPKMPRPSFSAPARPPGAPSRRPPPLRSGSTGLCPGAEPEPRPPALRPFGMGPPRAHSETDTTLHARTHSLTRSYTHNAPAQCPLRLASSRFHCAWRYPLLPPSGERVGHFPEAPGPPQGMGKPRGSRGQRAQG